MIKVKFYSEYDMACGYELQNVVDNINSDSYKSIESISDLFVFFNTLKYLDFETFKSYIENNSTVNSIDFKKQLNAEIGKYLSKNKKNIISLYDDVEFTDADDYFEIFDKYKLYLDITFTEFVDLTQKENFFVLNVLKYQNVSNKFDSILRPILLNEPQYVEAILNKFLGETNLYLPASFTESDTLMLIEAYINSSQPNPNYLKKIINFPNDRGLKITDIIKLNAKRRLKDENDKLFKSGSSFVYSIIFSSQPDLSESIKFKHENNNTEFILNLNWVKENLDFPTLWNNFIHLFGIIDKQGRILSVSKKNGHSPLEELFIPTGNHLFRTTRTFDYLEMFNSIIIRGYLGTLDKCGVNIETMIEWFFKVYLKEEFFIENFEVNLPQKDTTYFEKCRTILPEMDRIFKQFNSLIDNGSIDQELIQMSSFSYMTNQIESLNLKKYVYPTDTWFENVAFLLFSDQSKIFYLPKFKGKYKNFYELITSEDINPTEFKQHQLLRINVLIRENIITEDENGFYKFSDIRLVAVLKELYYEDVISYWYFNKELRDVIDKLFNEGKVFFEETLLSRNEQDYFDFYLNRSKFSNGYDIRNRYLHGTNSNDIKQHETDYYAILKLFIFVILKINDDFIIKFDFIKD